MTRLFPCIAAALILAGGMPAETLAKRQPAAPAMADQVEGQTVQAGVEGGYRYLLHIPAGYNRANGNWPVIVFLHGSGESGNDIEKVKVHGPPRLVQDNPGFPFIVISPQTPSARQGWEAAKLDTMLDAALKGLRVDADRIYLTGLSMGGMGSWQWASARPDRFAAVAPVAARGDTASVCALKDMPVWVFHGDDDQIVKAADDFAMVSALRACGGAPRLTIYPATGHDSWSATYADPALYFWLLHQRRKPR